MTVAMTFSDLTRWLNDHPHHCLFLDIDGTLAPFEPNPSHSKIPNDTLTLLSRLQATAIPVAIVTGRSLVEARQMLYPLQLPIGATYGLELAYLPQRQSPMVAVDLAQLSLITQQIRHAMKQHQVESLFLEEKPYSVALHCRQSPWLADTVATIMQTVAIGFVQWQLKQGKFVWEILPSGIDKGNAVNALLGYFNAGQTLPYCPIFIGDDISDEAGFLAVQARNGIGIKVGEPIMDSHATLFVQDIEGVTAVLQHILTCYQPVAKVEPIL